MADRSHAVLSILAATRARAQRDTDRHLAAALRLAVWVVEGREGPAPACPEALVRIGEALAGVYPDELLALTRALVRARLALSAEACLLLLGLAELRTVH